MANRAIQAKVEKARRQAMGVDVVAPRWSEDAGQFRATENTKAPYVATSKAELRALLARALSVATVAVTRVDTGIVKTPEARGFINAGERVSRKKSANCDQSLRLNRYIKTAGQVIQAQCIVYAKEDNRIVSR